MSRSFDHQTLRTAGTPAAIAAALISGLLLLTRP